MKHFPVGLVATAIALSSLSSTSFAQEDAAAQAEAAASTPSASSSVERPQFTPSSMTAPFLEQFTDDWSQRWSSSEATKEQKGGEVFSYSGKWSVEEPTVFPGLLGDKGLVLKTKANQHAISAQFDKVIDPKDKPLVVQYEVKMQKGLSCGGAYLKLLTESTEGIQEKEFSDKTPYTIMFGPDKCGSTNKVHFIFRHKNPITGEYEEKHLTNAPYPKISKTSTLYTLIVNPDNTFEILINNDSKRKGTLLEDFDPSVNPDKEIVDPDDKKPSDWVDEARIADPEAVKPEDWDEDAPLQILDESATKPESWLEDEPLTIPDPEAVKPEEWDDEEDGEWLAPLITNPKCQEEGIEGCGKWSQPLISNPNYKGKWSAPFISNPAYKGEWEPKKIKNPNYFEDANPSNFNPIAGIGFELWTMDEDILFDNIYIGHDPKEAKQFSEETFFVKKEIEEGVEKVENEKTKKEAEKLESKKGSGKSPKDQLVDFYQDQKAVVMDFVAAAREDPVEAIKDQPKVAGAIVAGVFGFFAIFGSILGGGGSSSSEKKSKTAASKPPKKVDAPKSSTSAVKPASSTTTKRNARVEDADE